MWYFLNDNDDKVLEYKDFDSNKIKEDIKQYLNNNPDDELCQYKVSNDKKYVGDNYIDAFVNRNGNVCKVIVRGNKEFYKRLR